PQTPTADQPPLYGSPTAPNTMQHKKKRTTAVIIAVAAALVLVVGVGVTTVLLLFGSSNAGGASPAGSSRTATGSDSRSQDANTGGISELAAFRKIEGDWIAVSANQYISEDYHPKVPAMLSFHISEGGTISFQPTSTMGLSRKVGILAYDKYDPENDYYDFSCEILPISISYDPTKDAILIFVVKDAEYFYLTATRSQS
ncbi:MAG: hypothetical protein IJK40_09000, partial [Clostridia bacterium]|nr:hypothetical protein [Clostridia bacterium]